MPALVIFDCDGVLVDSERIALRLNVEIGPELGWAITPDEVMHHFVGRSSASIRAVISERLDAAAAARWDERFIERHRAAVDSDLEAVAGIHEALSRITVPTCVASSGSHEKMRHTLGRTGLYEHFEGRIFSATEVRDGKPAPDLFLHAAARMGVDPSRCVVVEDSRYGVQAARAAGMQALGYCGGLTPREWLEGPDTRVFDDMSDLPALLAATPVTSPTS
ncbi:HAD family hydrolase [Nocardioides sp. CER19]|uniref:HAD family hydrolase n=1 Tax=Nocardioides sp. CER19 TaxID=3038538 RepID=UPI00244C5307|nr:HAD family hydrolase [Nocardioides sp. CER19]MDH2412926.1 HAD family hydrolase [Nocardioides sp. CER19]